MPTIQKAVVPAAGRGTRLQPLTDYLPKPMLPLGKKPVLQHITEELIEAGITEIAVIVQSDHDLIFDYFSKFPEIEFITDDSVSGPGGAILHAEEFVDGDDFITVFADAPATGNGRDKHIENLLHIKNAEEAEAVVSIYRVPGAEASSRGVVTLEDPNDSVTDPARIVDIIEKPPEIPKGEQ